MSKLDQLREMRERGTVVTTAPPKPAKAKGRKNEGETTAVAGLVAGDTLTITGTSHFDGEYRVLQDLDVLGVGSIKVVEPLKSVATTDKRRRVATTECPECAKRRKAKTDAMARYRANLAKKLGKVTRARKKK